MLKRKLKLAGTDRQVVWTPLLPRESELKVKAAMMVTLSLAMAAMRSAGLKAVVTVARIRVKRAMMAIVRRATAAI